MWEQRAEATPQISRKKTHYLVKMRWEIWFTTSKKKIKLDPTQCRITSEQEINLKPKRGNTKSDCDGTAPSSAVCQSFKIIVVTCRFLLTPIKHCTLKWKLVCSHFVLWRKCSPSSASPNVFDPWFWAPPSLFLRTGVWHQAPPPACTNC